MDIPIELIKQTHEVLTRSVLPGIEYDLVTGIFLHIGTLIPVMNRISPPYNVAIPAIQGIVFNSDTEILQNMFYALLTKSMDKTKQHNVHPAFPKILGELSVDDIKIIYIVNKNNGTYHYKLEKEFDITEITNSDFPITLLELFKSRMSYLSKLGVLQGSETTILAYSGYSDSAPSSLEYPITLTPFGKQFIEACLSPKTEKLIQELIDNP